MKINLEELQKGRNKKTNGFLPIAQRFDGSDIALPLMAAIGKEDGPVLVIDGCQHGDEHEAALGIIKLMQSLDTNTLKGSVIGVPVVNVLAFEQGERVTPSAYMGGDQNRSYPGAPIGQGNINQGIAYFYANEVIKKVNADCVITMHSGGNKLTISALTAFCAPTNNPKVDKKQLEIAKALGPKFLWGGIPHVGSIFDIARYLDIPVIATEIGGHALRSEHIQEIIDIYYNGLKNVMRTMGMLNEKVETVDDPISVEMPLYMTCTKGGFFRAEKISGHAKKGERMGVVSNFFGETVEELIAPFDGIVCAYWSYPLVAPGNWAILLGKEKI